MRHPIAMLLVAAMLSACGTSIGRVPWRDDIDGCEQEAARAPRVQSTPQRMVYVDRCMEAKGWRATPACRELQLEGSPAFCDYRR